MKLFAAALAVCFCAGFGVSEEKEKKKFDPASIVGKWKTTEGMKNGEKVSDDNLKGEVTIAKDTITIKGNDETHVMEYKIDATKSPMEINMKGKDGPAKDFTAEGIIEVDGETIKLAYTTNIPGFDGKRPTKFEAPKDSKAFYFVMKKAK